MIQTILNKNSQQFIKKMKDRWFYDTIFHHSRFLFGDYIDVHQFQHCFWSSYNFIYSSHTLYAKYKSTTYAINDEVIRVIFLGIDASEIGCWAVSLDMFEKHVIINFLLIRWNIYLMLKNDGGHFSTLNNIETTDCPEFIKNWPGSGSGIWS